MTKHKNEDSDYEGNKEHLKQNQQKILIFSKKRGNMLRERGKMLQDGGKTRINKKNHDMTKIHKNLNFK